MEKEYEHMAASKAAHEVIRKYSVELCTCFLNQDIPIRLYADRLINQVTFEKYANRAIALADFEKAQLMLLDVQRSVSQDVEGINKLCSVLCQPRDEEISVIAANMKEAYVLELDRQMAAIRAQMSERQELERLRKQLEGFKITSQMDSSLTETLNKISQRSLQDYMEKSLKGGKKVQTIKKHLNELNEEFLISPEMLTWALKMVDDINLERSSTNPFINVKQPLDNRFIGDGSYARVQIVTDGKGIEYAAKRFLRSRCKEFSSEFALLAQLRHDNIVCYIGLAGPFSPDEHPAIIMELLETDLHRYIISSQPMALPTQLKILRDVALGLNYLHTYSPIIIHRDLTAKNVLLDSTGLAKIADFGNSRMVSKEQLTTMTSNVGTLVYLAPEALGNNYNEKIDIFSYGHLMLFILIENFPDSLLPASYFDKDPDNGIHVPKVCLEVDRRQHYLNDLEEKVNDDSIVQLVKKCLSNKPEDRPAASQLIIFLKTPDDCET